MFAQKQNNFDLRTNMERFNTLEQSDVTYFKEKFKVRNTNKSTDNWIRDYETSAVIKKYDAKKTFEQVQA